MRSILSGRPGRGKQIVLAAILFLLLTVLFFTPVHLIEEPFEDHDLCGCAHVAWIPVALSGLLIALAAGRAGSAARGSMRQARTALHIASHIGEKRGEDGEGVSLAVAVPVDIRTHTWFILPVRIGLSRADRFSRAFLYEGQTLMHGGIPS